MNIDYTNSGFVVGKLTHSKPKSPGNQSISLKKLRSIATTSIEPEIRIF